MELRNKKTGEIIIPTDYTFATYDDGIKYGHHIYYSLAELNENWEDYTPAEPLIKDEKIRKAVRAWAEAESIPPEETLFYNAGEHSFGWYRSVVEFSKDIQGLKENEYTIAELCGEEKE